MNPERPVHSPSSIAVGSRRSCRPGRHRLPRSARRRAAFTLIELVFAVTMLGLFALAYSRIFNSANAITRAAPREDSDAARLDMALGVLCRDVWRARQIGVAEPHTVVLRHHDTAEVITWNLDDRGTLMRTVLASPSLDPRAVAADPVRGDTWEGMASLRGFAAGPSGLIVTLRERWIQRDSQMLLTSQVLAAGRASP